MEMTRFGLRPGVDKTPADFKRKPETDDDLALEAQASLTTPPDGVDPLA